MRRSAWAKCLSQGSERAAKIWGNGADECLITVKGAEAPAHMPQAKRSLGLIYAVNPFGADHQSTEHDPYYEEGVADLNLNRLKLIGLGAPQPGYSLTPEKVRFAYLTEVFYSMLDSLELCQFVFGPTWTLYGPAETVEMINAVTGWDMTVDELMAVGERRIEPLPDLQCPRRPGPQGRQTAEEVLQATGRDRSHCGHRSDSRGSGFCHRPLLQAGRLDADGVPTR